MAYRSSCLTVATRILAAFLAMSGVAAAGPILRPFPTQLIKSYASVLRRGEIAVVETDAAGWSKQITLFGYAAAPPALCYGLVADPGIYPRYVRNLTRSDVERLPDGAILNRWKLSFPVGSVEGTDEVRLVPSLHGPGLHAVELRSRDPGKQGTLRWEFLPLPDGGTLVVSYGYYDPLDSGFLRLLIGKNPALDAGFNLAGGLALLRSLLAEANREARKTGPHPTATEPDAGPAPDFAPLLARGAMAIVRSGADGSLQDASVVERVPAPAERLQEMVRNPELLPRLLHTVRNVVVTQRDATGLEYDMTVSAMLIEMVTTLRMHLTPGGADTLAIGGAAKGARFRWDIRTENPSSSTSIVVWRGNLHMGDTSRIMRAMLRIEPSFEHSANLTVGLMSVRSLAATTTAR